MALDDILVDPETRERLTRATDAQLEAIREAIAAGRARRGDSEPLPEAVNGAFLSNGGRWAYVDVEGIPSFLVEARLTLDEPV